MADDALNECRHMITKLEEGECIVISRDLLSMIQCNPFNGQSPVDRILEGLMGSSYNLRYVVNMLSGDVRFECVKDDGRKWNEPDPDRRSRFMRLEDGSLGLIVNSEVPR